MNRRGALLTRTSIAGFGLTVAFGWQAPASAQLLRQLTDVRTSEVGAVAVDDSGSLVVAVTSADPFGLNPDHEFRLVAWTFPGAAGVELPGAGSVDVDTLSVTDDGSWIYFISRDDLLPGGNPDLGAELFRVQDDGTGLTQMTTVPAGGGECRDAVVAGSGSRLVLQATIDPLGTNPAHDEQLFVASSDGTMLVQLTSFSGGTFDGIAVSDDGTRIAFSSDADPLGLNPDGGYELFTVFASGAGLMQRTVAPFVDSVLPAVSGDGQGLACRTSNGRVLFRPFGGTGTFTEYGETLARWGPSMPDDGSMLYFAESGEIVGVPTAGGPSIAVAAADGVAVVTGDGATVAHGVAVRREPSSSFGPHYAQFGLVAVDADGSNPRQLVLGAEPRLLSFDAEPDLDAAGSSLVFTTTYLGSATFDERAIMRIETDGSGLRQLVEPGPTHPMLSDDGATLVYRGFDELGCGLPQVYGANGDGGARIALTVASPSCLSPDINDYPALSGDGTRAVYTGAGATLRVVSTAGGPSAVIDDDGAIKQHQARVDGDGTWIVYHSETNDDGQNPGEIDQVFRAQTDGTQRQRLTSDVDHPARFPDLSADGRRVVFTSSADPLGTNTDHHLEIFLFDGASGSTTQLTGPAPGDRPWARISADGQVVWFWSTRPLTGGPGREELYRLVLSGGPLQRVSGLADRLSGTYEGLRGIETLFYGNFGVPRRFDNRSLTVDNDGDRAAFVASVDAGGSNPDRSYQLFFVDLSASPSIHVGASSPTLVSWDVEPSPWRYDVIRGDLADLSASGATIDLGPVVCIEDDSLDARTAGDEDALQPVPGQVLFYLYRGAEPAAPGSYGNGSDGATRVASTGDCPT